MQLRFALEFIFSRLIHQVSRTSVRWPSFLMAEPLENAEIKVKQMKKKTKEVERKKKKT